MNIETNKYLKKVKEILYSKHLMNESLISKEEFQQVMSNLSELLVWYILEYF